MTVTNSAQCFHWEEYGFSLCVPDNSLPPNTDKCYVHISVVNLSASSETLQGYKLVSSVYRIKCEPELQFQRDLIIKIQHCANSEVTNLLQFARKTDSDSCFTLLVNGDFSADSCYGTLPVNQFSCFAVLIGKLLGMRVQEKRYCAILFHKILSAREVDIVLAICYDLLAHMKVSIPTMLINLLLNNFF